VTPGLTASFAEIELDTETGKFKIVKMLTVADCGTVLHPQGLGHQIRGGNVMGIGMARLERHVYDPKLGIPAAALLYQAKPPTYLDVPAEIDFAAVELPDPQNPMGVKGVGEPPLGSGASAITTAIADAMGGHLFNRTPVSTDMILLELNGRPQAHKPLQVNSV
jgi:CO/xanthine dehydrogenase Mo-binding subunit